MRKLRVLVLMHPTLVPPDSLSGFSAEQINEWKTEYHVVQTLRRLGHEVRVLGVQDELLPIRQSVPEWDPHIVFNLLEEFHGIREFDQHVVSYLELLQSSVHRLQPARTDHRARQGAREEDRRVPPYPHATLRHRSAGDTACAARRISRSRSS